MLTPDASTVGPRATLRERAVAAWRRLRGGELTPLRAALSVAIGLAIGVTPLWGLHLVLVLAVCLPLRLDVPLAYFAANISIPVIAPFLTMAELEIGSFLLTGSALPLDLARVEAHGATFFLKELIVGTVFFSPSIALVGGALAYAVVRAAKPPTPLDLALDRVARRYASGGSRSAYYYVRGKLAGDPVAQRVLELAGPPSSANAQGALGEVLDVGCGRGQLGVLLLEHGAASRVTGFDWDADKVDAATNASQGLDATFTRGDLRELTGERTADTVLLVDVLHYLTDSEQDDLLRRAARASRRLVVVRELDPDRGLRSALTRLQESITTRLRYNEGARVNVRPIASLVAVLTAEGLSVDVTPCWGATPFSNVLLVARRP